jgi:hypothetical protein
MHYSLRTLLGTVTGFALALALVNWLGGGFLATTVWESLRLGLLGALASIAWHARGERRVFWLGAAAGAAVSAVNGPLSASPSPANLAAALVSIAAAGLAAVGVARVAVRKDD